MGRFDSCQFSVLDYSPSSDRHATDLVLTINFVLVVAVFPASCGLIEPAKRSLLHPSKTLD
ncbi:MAG: hypothetical protein V7L19_10145 [Nostoc sp.]